MVVLKRKKTRNETKSILKKCKMPCKIKASDFCLGWILETCYSKLAYFIWTFLCDTFQMLSMNLLVWGTDTFQPSVLHWEHLTIQVLKFVLCLWGDTDCVALSKVNYTCLTVHVHLGDMILVQSTPWCSIYHSVSTVLI